MKNKQKLKIAILNILLLFVGIFVAVGAAELALRIYRPEGVFRTVKYDMWWMRQTIGAKKMFVYDPDFGFRPILEGELYNKYGTLNNGYSLEKKPSVTRLLFIGDSVTVRGGIVDNLKSLYKEDRFEYWNAGVESFNTVQEVKFYKKYNYLIKPDHVILTFLFNDFETTPVVFFDKKGLLRVYAPKLLNKQINIYLFQQCYLYRFFLGLGITFKTMRSSNKEIIEEDIVDEVKEALIELRDLLDQDGIAFTVLIHPVLSPKEQWNIGEKKTLIKIRKMLQELNIRFFDLSEILDEAVDDNMVLREVPSDPLHPSRGLCSYYARYLYNNNLN